LSYKTAFFPSGVPVTQAYIPSYLGGWDQEDHGSRPAWANSLQDPISKITKTKWIGSVAQVVECLLCRCKALSSNPRHTHTHTTHHNTHTHTHTHKFLSHLPIWMIKGTEAPRRVLKTGLFLSAWASTEWRSSSSLFALPSWLCVEPCRLHSEPLYIWDFTYTPQTHSYTLINLWRSQVSQSLSHWLHYMCANQQD
jgi:hypothetical protein